MATGDEDGPLFKARSFDEFVYRLTGEVLWFLFGLIGLKREGR